MGFWDVTKRMLEGKPAFEMPAPDKDDAEDAFAAAQPAGSEDKYRISRNQRVDQRGYKVVPEAEIARVKFHENGQSVEIWATIRNQSDFAIMLDKIVVFGVSQELDYPLAPGGSREFMIYRGNQRRDDAYKYAELYYLDKDSGDYFCAAHMIQYEHRPDGTYDVAELSLVRPIKDV